MALSDSEVGRVRRVKNRKMIVETNKQWSDKQRLEAVQSWLVLGNLALTSRLLSIPEPTLRVWKASEWWRNAVDDIKVQDNLKMSARLKTIVDAGLSVVSDRLEHGDFIYDQKTGQMVRKAVAMKDAHKVATDLMDRQKILEKALEPTQVVEGNDDKLLKLAEKFAAFVTEKIEHKEDPLPMADVVDVDIKEK